jgi:ubiquinol-cytochrome c reductase cytochrome c subunit
VKKIIGRRRHPLAFYLVLAIALLSVGTFYAALSAAPSAEATTARSQQIEEGRQLFLKGCSSCHGINAEGGSSGPTLIGVGAASVDFQVGTGRMPMAEVSQQAERKPPKYNEEETAALAMYVASLAPGPAIPTADQLNYERDGNSAEGGALFRTNCAMCHNAAGQGGALTQGKYAPTLMGVSAKHFYEAMVTGPQAMPVFADTTLTPQQKLSIIKFMKDVETERNLGGASLGRVGPVTEGLFAWVVGLGLLIGTAVWLGAKAQ